MSRYRRLNERAQRTRLASAIARAQWTLERGPHCLGAELEGLVGPPREVTSSEPIRLHATSFAPSPRAPKLGRKRSPNALAQFAALGVWGASFGTLLVPSLCGCSTRSSNVTTTQITLPPAGSTSPAPAPAEPPPDTTEPEPSFDLAEAERRIGECPPLDYTPAPDERLAASHILVSYQGATAAKPEVIRSYADARARAKSIYDELVDGAEFAELAREDSDCPSSANGGTLGTFKHRQMVRPFSDAVAALKSGDICIVETRFGFHIVLRQEPSP